MLQEGDYEHAQFIYYTPRKLDKESQIWPVRGGRSLAKPYYKVGPKRIECYSLHLVQEGELWLEFQDKRVRLGKHGLFCLFPGYTYYYRAAAPEPVLRLSWIVMDGPRTKDLLELAGLTPETPYKHLADPVAIEEIMDRMHLLMLDAANWSSGVSLELQSLLFSFFAQITSDRVDKPVDEPAGWIQECIHFMELHASEGVSVQQVATFAGVHRSYLSSVFTRVTGISPLGYLQKIRMEKAKRLLRETDATVTEIALSLGYPNLFSFTRAFKKYCTVPPAVFRAQE